MAKINQIHPTGTLLQSDSLSEECVSRILDIEAVTFQKFLDGLNQILSDFSIQSISLLAPSLHRKQQLELIASTIDDVPPRVWRQEEEYLASLFMVAYKSGDSELCLSIRGERRISSVGVIAKGIQTKLKEIVSSKRQHIRRSVIEQSIKSKDVNSFLFRLAHALRKDFVFAQDISIFLHYEKGKKLSLAASTSLLQGLEKKDIYYQTADDVPTVQCFAQNAPIVMDKQTNPESEEFDKNILQFDVDVRGYWPIGLAWSDFSSLRGQNIAPIGTIKVSAPERRSPRKTWDARFSDYDHILISFIAEVIFVLVQQYQQFMSAETDLARLTHGLGANIEASIKFAANIKDMLFFERDDPRYDIKRPRYTPAFTIVGKSHYDASEIYLSLKDLEFFLDDLNYQFVRIQDVRYEKEVIDKLHSDVLMPAVNLTPAIAAVHSKETPQISNLISRGSINVPPVMGNRKGFILVLRNLFENSIKYGRGKTTAIDFSFEEDDHNVVIEYYDTGIGVENSDVEQIFVEGYRSLAARRVSNRGIGIGLSSSRDVMRALDGELTCLPHVGGAHFRLRMRKAR
jgi:signal transduction histidine kinase